MINARKTKNTFKQFFSLHVLLFSHLCILLTYIIFSVQMARVFIRSNIFLVLSVCKILKFFRAGPGYKLKIQI